MWFEVLVFYTAVKRRAHVATAHKDWQHLIPHTS